MQTNTPFYLFISLETNGDGRIMTQTPIRIALVVTDADQQVLLLESFFIKKTTTLAYNPCNYTLSQINNGLSPQDASAHIMELVSQVVQNNGNIIAHNTDFVTNLLLQLGADLSPFHTFTRCIMKESVNVCKLGYGNKYKYPKLIELCTFLFPHQVQHLGFDSAEDKAWAVKKCFFELKNNHLDI
jgi:hypothetical protein